MPSDRLRAALEACRVECPACLSTYRSDPCATCGGNGKTIGRVLPPAVAELLAAARAEFEPLAAALRDWCKGCQCAGVCEDCRDSWLLLAAYDAAAGEAQTKGESK